MIFEREEALLIKRDKEVVPNIILYGVNCGRRGKVVDCIGTSVKTGDCQGDIISIDGRFEGVPVTR